MKHVFIVNLKIINKNRKLIEGIYNYCVLKGLDFEIVETYDMEDMKNAARSYRNNNSVVYAVGDDAIVNAILNEIANSKALLGVIPVGDYNDFYRSLDEFKDSVIDTNVIKVNNRFGINTFSVGLDAEIYKARGGVKDLSVPLFFQSPLSRLNGMVNSKSQLIGINNDFKKRTLFAVCNGCYYLNGMVIAPIANIRKNVVDVVNVGDIPKILFPYLMYKTEFGNHVYQQFVESYKTDAELYIEADSPLTSQLDGRLMEEQTYQIEPHATDILVVNNRELIRILRKNKQI